MADAFDILLNGGTVIDGSGSAAYVADVGVSGDRVAAIGELSDASARQTLDVSGLYVCPGFIDVHTHSDLSPLLATEHYELRIASIRQGVTTQICGNCGFSVFPAAADDRHHTVVRHLRTLLGPDARTYETLSDYAEALEAVGMDSNVATLVGHGTVRASAMGFRNERADETDLRMMCALTKDAMSAGAAGLSTGLLYSPGSFASTVEIIELARATASFGGLYVTHMRNEMDHVAAAIVEALRVGAESGAPVHISHFKTAGKQNWGRTEETLALISGARASAVDVTIDVYPYTSASTILAAVLPSWVAEGGIDEMMVRLASPKAKDRIRRDLANGIDGWQRFVPPDGWGDVRIASAPRQRHLEGQSVADIAADSGVDEVDTVAELLRSEQGEVTVVIDLMAEDDVARVLSSHASMIGSDGIPVPGKPHPRWAGSFARILARYVRDSGLLGLEEAIHKMTGFPASRFSLQRRGELAVGAFADIVVFDLARVEDRATYDEPLLPATGILHVLVNGSFAVRDGASTDLRAGRFLAREGRT